MSSQVLDLQDIKLRHLEGLMPKMQAVVLSKLLYFMKHDEYAMQIDGEIYIKKRMTEWIKLIEIHFLNGTVRNPSKSSICKAFAELIKKGYLSSVLRGKVRCFRIIGEQLLKNIRAIFGQSSEITSDKEADKKEEISINTNEEKDDFCQKSSQQPVQRMFQIWQKEFPDSDEVLTKQVSAWLKAAFDEKFAKNFYEWSCYLRKVKTSSFIMERPHLQRLSWVLSFDTITKIQQGGYNVSEPDPDPEELKRYERELWAKLSQEIEDLSEDPICKKQRHKILETIGVFDYKAWFSKVSMELCGENFKCYGSPLVEGLIQDKFSHLLFYHGYERPDRTELSSFGDISGMLMKKIFSKPLENFQ